MSNSKNIINILIIVLLVGVGVIGYFYFFGGEAETNDQLGLQQLTTDGASNVVGGDRSEASEFVILLNNLRSVDLKSSIFSNPAFAGDLQDFTTPLPDRQKGRSNPFAPLGTGNINTTPIPANEFFR
jgi:hypothetical protein